MTRSRHMPRFPFARRPNIDDLKRAVSLVDFVDGLLIMSASSKPALSQAFMPPAR